MIQYQNYIFSYQIMEQWRSVVGAAGGWQQDAVKAKVRQYQGVFGFVFSLLTSDDGPTAAGSRWARLVTAVKNGDLILCRWRGVRIGNIFVNSCLREKMTLFPLNRLVQVFIGSTTGSNSSKLVQSFNSPKGNTRSESQLVQPPVQTVHVDVYVGVHKWKWMIPHQKGVEHFRYLILRVTS